MFDIASLMRQPKTGCIAFHNRGSTHRLINGYDANKTHSVIDWAYTTFPYKQLVLIVHLSDMSAQIADMISYVDKLKQQYTIIAEIYIP
jgi:hypothetical protein